MKQTVNVSPLPLFNKTPLASSYRSHSSVEILKKVFYAGNWRRLKR